MTTTQVAGRPRSIPTEHFDTVLKLYADGEGYRRIAKQLGSLNQSQSGIYMDDGLNTGLSGSEELLCPSLQDSPAPLLDLFPPRGQLGEEVPHFSGTAALVPKHKFAVASSRAQSQIASAALKSGLYPGRLTNRRSRRPAIMSVVAVPSQ